MLGFETFLSKSTLLNDGKYYKPRFKRLYN